MVKEFYKSNIKLLAENNPEMSGKDMELVAGAMTVADTATAIVKELPYYAGKAALFPMWSIMKVVEGFTEATLSAYEKYVEENEAQK